MDNALLKEYYVDYYHHALNIKNYEKHVEKRFHEEESALARVKNRLSNISGMIPTAGKVLIIGGGTGAEMCAFHTLGYDVWMIEPDARACELSKQRALDANIDVSRVLQGVAEELPFEENFFDFVWSYMVFEHVNDYEKSLKEATRVLKPQGWMYISFPDYRSLFEAHYNISMPLFLGKTLNLLILKILKKNTAFLKKYVNFINAKRFMNIASSLPIIVFRKFNPVQRGKFSFGNYATYMIQKYLSIEHICDFYIKKN